MVLYGRALQAFTLFFPDFAGDYCEAHANVSHKTEPLPIVSDLADYAASNGLLATLTSNVLLQVVMNVVLFVPLGFFLAYRGRRPFGATVLIGLAISLAIELTQGTGLWGLAPCPYRLADVDDLLTNTAGALLGWFIGRAAIRFLPDPMPVKRSDVDPPGPTRQTVGFFLDIYTYLLIDVIIIITLGLLGTDLLEQPGWPIVLPASVSLMIFVLIPRLRRDRRTGNRRGPPGSHATSTSTRRSHRACGAVVDRVAPRSRRRRVVAGAMPRHRRSDYLAFVRPSTTHPAAGTNATGHPRVVAWREPE